MILVTGAAGFIGFHTAKKLLGQDEIVIGVDNLSDYYDISLKKARLAMLKKSENFVFYEQDLADFNAVANIFNTHKITKVIHLAAQPGVRYSLENPQAYIHSNINGFFSVLECAKNFKVEHFVFASTSSVYGANEKQPYSEAHSTEHQVSFYGATKKSNEMLAHSYASMYKLPCTGLRFFTVYGPWGRPDMSYHLFVDNILAGREIEVFNNGDMMRDFTYVDDIVDGIVKIKDYSAKPNANWRGDAPDPGSSYVPYSIYNIGCSKPVQLMDYIAAIEENLQKKAKIKFLPMQIGDVKSTWSDSSKLFDAIGYMPKTQINVGVKEFIRWYKEYYIEKKEKLFV